MGLKRDEAAATKLALATRIAAGTAAGTAVEAGVAVEVGTERVGVMITVTVKAAVIVGAVVAETAAPRSHQRIETAKTAITEARAKATANEETLSPPIKRIPSSSLV